MKVTIKGLVTIPLEVREDLGIASSEAELDFIRDENGRWYLEIRRFKRESRFRIAHSYAKPIMTTDELMLLTRGSFD